MGPQSPGNAPPMHENIMRATMIAPNLSPYPKAF